MLFEGVDSIYLSFFSWGSHVASTAHTFGVDKVNFLNVGAQFPCDCLS